MKILRITPVIIILFFGGIGYSQILTSTEAQKLAEVWNSTITDSICLSLNKDQAFLKFNKVDHKLDIRTKSAIARDSISKKEIKEKYYYDGRYIGDMFWQYDFEALASSGTSFKTNTSGKLFLTFQFSENDTILIKSSLNEFTSHHRTLDSFAHKVQWSNDKYISVLLQGEKANDFITFSVSGLTLSGKFERVDKKPLNKNYTKTLRGILKREFEKVFNEIVLKKEWKFYGL